MLKDRALLKRLEALVAEGKLDGELLVSPLIVEHELIHQIPEATPLSDYTFSNLPNASSSR